MCVEALSFLCWSLSFQVSERNVSEHHRETDMERKQGHVATCDRSFSWEKKYHCEFVVVRWWFLSTISKLYSHYQKQTYLNEGWILTHLLLNLKSCALKNMSNTLHSPGENKKQRFYGSGSISWSRFTENSKLCKTENRETLTFPFHKQGRS